MGRPNHVKPSPVGGNRRDFFKRSSSVAVSLSAAPMLPLGSVALAASVNTMFQHGVASGDPLTDRVILWTRVTPASAKSVVPVTFVVATDPALTNIVLRGNSKTNPGRDYTVKIDAIGLRANTTCYHQFGAEGALSAVGRTKTLPAGPTTSLPPRATGTRALLQPCRPTTNGCRCGRWTRTTRARTTAPIRTATWPT